MTRKSRILVVDDSPSNIDVILEVLEELYVVIVATNGAEALSIVKKNRPDLILLDIMMPDMNGYEVINLLKADERTNDIPVIFLTALDEVNDEVKGLDMGAVDYVVKPFSPKLLKRRVQNHIALKNHRDHLESLVSERTRMLNLTQDVTIESLGNLAEYRDQETGGHIKRTKNYVRALALGLREKKKYAKEMSDSHIELLTKSAPLHDIGKVGVPDSILMKPGKLTAREFEEMKEHTVYGRDIIRASEKNLGEDSFLSLARKIAYSHHEKWDGSGYPQGLIAEDIPLSGRIMAVADVYDALISKRVYKPPFPHKKAVEIIRKDRGGHFDPDVTDVFLQMEEQFRKIALEYADFDEEREMLSEK
ncbi:MAG: response regulator [Desulfobacteraceae bacterium]